EFTVVAGHAERRLRRLLKKTSRTNADCRNTPPDMATGTVAASGKRRRTTILASPANSAPAWVRMLRAETSPASAAASTQGNRLEKSCAVASSEGEALAARTSSSIEEVR